MRISFESMSKKLTVKPSCQTQRVTRLFWIFFKICQKTIENWEDNLRKSWRSSFSANRCWDHHLRFLLIKIHFICNINFLQDINLYAYTNEIQDYLTWYEIFSYEHLILARDWPEIHDSAKLLFTIVEQLLIQNFFIGYDAIFLLSKPIKC